MSLCKSAHVPVRDRAAVELRAVAPLIVLEPAPRLVGTMMLVANGERVLGVTSAELLRQLQGQAVAIVTKLDGSATVQIASWGMGRYSGIALVELAGPIAERHDVVPLQITSVHASVNTHSAPSAIVIATMEAGGTYGRLVIDVDVDADTGAGMGDRTVFLATATDPAYAAVTADGAPVFAWLLADPALGRKSEVVAFALASPYRAQLVKPRELPVLAELVALDDLGRALLVAPPAPADDRPALVTGEIIESAPPVEPSAK